MNNAPNKEPNKETMTSRQRVLRAVNHQEADRMPIDLGFHYSTGISAFAYQRLRACLGLPDTPAESVDLGQFLPRVADDVLRRFHCDCLLLHPGWRQTHLWNPRGDFRFQVPTAFRPALRPDGGWVAEKDGQAMRMPAGGFFFDGACARYDDRPPEETFAATVREAERIFKDTDYFTMYIGYHAYFVCDDMDWQCRMLTDPEEILEENRQIHRRQLAHLGRLLKEMGGYIQAVALNSDLGNQGGPMCSPALYADLCAPFVKEFCDFVHQNSDCKVFLHCCGSVKPFLPILVDCGLDILNPVQFSAANMDPAELKRVFGHKLTFWGGGCNTQQILNKGTPAEVAANVRELVGIFKPQGGFVFNQVHNIMGDIAPENITAMLDTAYAESFY
jgi:uroporphyrinogen decarboxylase